MFGLSRTLFGVALLSGCWLGDRPAGQDEAAEEESPEAEASTDTGVATDSAAPASDPRAEACHPTVNGWPVPWTRREFQVVALTNQRRSVGAHCGPYGWFPPAPPLRRDPALTCAARYHSRFMGIDSGFHHAAVDGDLGASPIVRMRAAGWEGAAGAENIAAGHLTPREVVASWMDSPSHCRNLMTPELTEIGVGHAVIRGSEYTRYWTQELGLR